MEGDALRGDGGVEVGEGFGVFVRDGLVEVDPRRVSAGCGSGV
jgi:hypothetical protein